MYYRTNEAVLPPWIESFVKTGYAHYCTLLPTAFTDEDANVDQVAAMLGFLFSMESLALSLGCDRSQLEIAVTQSHPEEAEKIALLWAARVQLGTLSRSELRDRCDELLGNPLVLPAYPRYISGLVHALEPVPGLVDFVVEAVSNAFGRLPDTVLLPWLPTLIMALRKSGADLASLLVREAGRVFPARLDALDAWEAPWKAEPVDPAAVLAGRRAAGRDPGGPVGTLLAAHPATCDAVAGLLGCEGEWSVGGDGAAGGGLEIVTRYPDTAAALAGLAGLAGPAGLAGLA